MKPDLNILVYPDPCLRKKCQEVTEFGPHLLDLGQAMLELMSRSNGVGLAGPQVGICSRIFVCSPSGEADQGRILVNPQLHDLEGREVSEEGCLSIPEVAVKVSRAQRCRLTARGPLGEPIELVGQELEARIWQHECDHLAGRLILDYMDEAERIANRRALKQLEAGYKG